MFRFVLFLAAAPDQLVEQSETVRILGPGVGGFLLLVLGTLLISRKWPKNKTRGQEAGEYHATLRGTTTASHETIRALHADQQATLRQAIDTIDRLATGSHPKIPPAGPQGGTPPCAP